MIREFCTMTLVSAAFAAATAAFAAGEVPWRSDLGNGTYRNPVLYADYSDPDAIRVGEDYWMVSSSFSHVPGLPILHSRDLVNWSLVAHALPRLVPEDVFSTPQHGKGVWAPSLRHHSGKYWIYYPDPDFGLYVMTAADPRGPWSAPQMVKAGKGLIDPCPLWDDDGTVYLIHAWARSRAGISNVLTLLRLNSDGTQVEEDLGVIIDGGAFAGYTTLEGPKLYKRDGWYYVFAPAGGVKTGWQSVFRARSIRGPYEGRIVLAQGSTPVNGPHQGALVDTPTGEEWFLHFQDKDAYGRIVHLQPVVWKDGWPVIGSDPDGDGKGEPVLTFRKPQTERVGAAHEPQVSPVPASDEFDSPQLGLQWQWQANPRAEWSSLTARPGYLRLFAQPATEPSLYQAPYLLLQKFPAPEFTVTAKLEITASSSQDASGLIVFGYDYAWIGVEGGKLIQVTVRDASDKARVTRSVALDGIPGAVFLRVSIQNDAMCRFSYSTDGRVFTPVGEPFQARVGRWVGAKVGVFATGSPGSAADWDYVRFEPLQP